MSSVARILTSFGAQKAYWDKAHPALVGPLGAKEIAPYIKAGLKVGNIEIEEYFNILDYGCGIGRLYDALGRPKCNYIGFDISERYHNEVIKNFNDPNTTWILSNSGKPFFRESYFNIILCYSVFTHLTFEQSKPLLWCLHYYLKEEGVALISFFINKGQSQHWTIFEEDRLGEIIDNAGFTSIGYVEVPEHRSGLGYNQYLVVLGK